MTELSSYRALFQRVAFIDRYAVGQIRSGGIVLATIEPNFLPEPNPLNHLTLGSHRMHIDPDGSYGKEIIIIDSNTGLIYHISNHFKPASTVGYINVGLSVVLKDSEIDIVAGLGAYNYLFRNVAESDESHILVTEVHPYAASEQLRILPSLKTEE